MKKPYSAPEILYESFLLSKGIASDCTQIQDNQTQGVCAMTGTGGISVFTEGLIRGCVYDSRDLGGGEDEYDGICYHVPIETYKLFGSGG